MIHYHSGLCHNSQRKNLPGNGHPFLAICQTKRVTKLFLKLPRQFQYLKAAAQKENMI